MMIMLIIVMIMCNLHLQAPWMTWVKGQRGRRVRRTQFRCEDKIGGSAEGLGWGDGG